MTEEEPNSAQIKRNEAIAQKFAMGDQGRADSRVEQFRAVLRGSFNTGHVVFNPDLV